MPNSKERLSNGKKSLNKEGLKDEDMPNGQSRIIRRTSRFRYEWGGLDVISGLVILGGLYLTQIDNPFGWLLLGIGVLKQLSNR